ncbi:twin-arginine translocase subunit TatC [Candidatus Fermentibacterales bacterium]|nr:twin-arginine translocase subunit TatC [Candidatus Fermentibacterales bacterium]
MVRASPEGSFWDHLEELRQRILVVLGVLTVSTLTALIAFGRTLTGFVISRGPSELLALSPSEALVAHLKVSLVAGIILSSPVGFYHLWRFISPGLLDRERKVSAAAAASCFLLFAGGALFAWFLMLEPVTGVLQSFEGGTIRGGWSVSSYIGFVGRMVLVFGVAFELPVLVLLLVGLGVLRPSTLARYRRHVIVALLVAAAILTPPDPLTQVMLAAPLYLLFELSVLAARVTGLGKRTGAAGEEVA